MSVRAGGAEPMFLDVKELAVRKLRIHKAYALGSIDFHSAEIKQIEPLEVTATAELLEGQIRVEGNLETKVELVCARCLEDRKSTRLNSSHGYISYAVFCLKKQQHETVRT